MFMLPPTYLTCLEIGQYADPAERARRGAGRARSRCSCPRSSEDDDGGTLSIPPRLETLLETRT